jgi:hypothetical protein
MEFRKVDVHKVEKGVGLVRTRKHVEKDEGPLQGSNETNHLVTMYSYIPELVGGRSMDDSPYASTLTTWF